MTMIQLPLFACFFIACWVAPSVSLEHNNNHRRQLQETLTLQFSLWHPGFVAQDAIEHPELLVDPILQVIQDFLCEETDLILLENRLNVCERILQGEGQAIMASKSLVVTDISGNDASSSSSMRWTTWVLTYQVVQVGENFQEQANEGGMNSTQVMENVAQLALDVSIMERNMDERLVDLGASMSPVGQELEKFAGLATQQQQQEELEELDLDYLSAARYLRWTGILLFLTNTAMLTYLTRLGMKRRLDRADQVLRQRQERGGLVTEEGVDQMLEVGRRESMKANAGSSDFIRPSSEFSSSSYQQEQAYVGVPVGARETRKSMIPNAANASQIDVEVQHGEYTV